MLCVRAETEWTEEEVRKKVRTESDVDLDTDFVRFCLVDAVR